jgi:hypothetical protein
MVVLEELSCAPVVVNLNIHLVEVAHLFRLSLVDTTAFALVSGPWYFFVFAVA